MKILVTGASRGIGLAICKELHNQGHQIIGLCRNINEKVLDVWHRDVSCNSELYSVDISNEREVQQFIEKVLEPKGYPDALINNAGITNDSFFHKMEWKQWSDVIDINLKSLFLITQPIYKQMIKNKFGRIINISSINGQKGQAGQTNYSAAKAGVHGFTMALAQEGARSNITVNTLSPGYTETDMIKHINPELLNTIRNSIPVKRFALPEEIAKAVNFLVNESSGYITGANVPVNGGLFIN
ncbi:acetoacetyl-CoA reductase [Colwellia piezophila]|uniref:acetoacetyl-CoA reductase n=1 Tax=Colwellia piezophila TaxID=211668 RepID=UPI00037C3CBD|nr:acetoacetyl-CoA reductase [Colwellia piezophila]